MSEKRTLSRWLRSQEVYSDDESPNSGSDSKAWRDVLLHEFDSDIVRPATKPAPIKDERYSLQVHHLIWMSVAGLGLFCLGWLFGNGTIAMDQLTKISPFFWMGGSIALSVGFLFWRRIGIWRRH